MTYLSERARNNIQPRLVKIKKPRTVADLINGFFERFLVPRNDSLIRCRQSRKP